MDERQLLYAIKSAYMSGPLRRGFYDLLISLHLESHATTMQVCFSFFSRVLNVKNNFFIDFQGSF